MSNEVNENALIDHSHTFLDTDKMADTRFQVNSFGVHSWRTYRVVCVYPATPEIPAKIYCDELARHHTVLLHCKRSR